MTVHIGRIAELVRYPVKSMAGTAVKSAQLGWHGLDGDRRFAFRRVGDQSGFPWLTGSRLAELILYRPTGVADGAREPLPTHVHTPGGQLLALRSPDLQREISERFGEAVELMNLRGGIFDDAPISVITRATIAGIGAAAGAELESSRFRANILLDTGDSAIFLEDDWVGGTLLFGDAEPRAAVRVAARDQRCVMINLDPTTALQDARVLKTVVRLNGNNAGVYATVMQTGLLRAGDAVTFVPGTRY